MNDLESYIQYLKDASSVIPGGSWEARALEEVSTRLNALETKQSFDTGWVSVQERLPEAGGFYLVYQPHWESISVAKFRGDWGSDDEDLTMVGITHWMALPNPPQKESPAPAPEEERPSRE